MRWWGVGEFELALKSVGCCDVTVSGNYDHARPPCRDDRVITFEARRN